MCGRYFFDLEIDEVVESFSIDESMIADVEKGEKHPGTEIPVILVKDGRRYLKTLYWGIKINGKSVINARFETADEKPIFKDLIAYSRCIIPASSFYEWKATGKTKDKMEIFRSDRSKIALGGIYGKFKDESGKERISVIILTVPASGSMSHIHHRMPLIVPKDLWDEWLDASVLSSDETSIIQRVHNLALDFKISSNIQQISFL
ncbi:MAG: SOS response-associated peptidase [Bacillota bacterium]|nr:SOS response-associated peptidase [Bacillota bacterium]